jgi:hypothetical protein
MCHNQYMAYWYYIESLGAAWQVNDGLSRLRWTGLPTKVFTSPQRTNAQTCQTCCIFIRWPSSRLHPADHSVTVCDNVIRAPLQDAKSHTRWVNSALCGNHLVSASDHQTARVGDVAMTGANSTRYKCRQFGRIFIGPPSSGLGLG